MMETAALGTFVARIMEQIEDQFDDDAKIRTVAVVVEVDTGDATCFRIACDDDRPWVQMEFLGQARDALADQFDSIRSDED
jgi:hypothetical protein